MYGEIRVLVGARDFAAATRFYGEVLGFPAQEHWDAPDARGTVVSCSRGGVIEIVENSPHHPAAVPSGVKVAIDVLDIDAFHELWLMRVSK